MDYSSLYFIALIFITLIFYLFPFIPALYEWKYKTDAEPFRVNFQDRNVVDYNIRLFKEYISTHFCDILPNYKDKVSEHSLPYYLIENCETLELEADDVANQNTNKVVLILEKGELPNHIHFKNKVYSSGSLATGNNNIFSEVYAEKDILLAAGTKVKKLVYAGESILVKENLSLNCYTKAEKKIHFSGAARFQYLHAQVIEFDPTAAMPYREAVDVIGANLPRKIKKTAYSLAANSDLRSHFLIKSSFNIATNCKILGNIKSYQDVKIGANTTIVGAIFSGASIFIADNCFIQGPLVANHSIHIGPNCFIGSSDSKTSIIAQYIHISKGCYTTGQILAKIKGIYLNE